MTTGTTEVAAKVTGRNASLNRKVLRRPRKTDIKGADVTLALRLCYVALQNGGKRAFGSAADSGGLTLPNFPSSGNSHAEKLN